MQVNRLGTEMCVCVCDLSPTKLGLIKKVYIETLKISISVR